MKKRSLETNSLEITSKRVDTSEFKETTEAATPHKYNRVILSLVFAHLPKYLLLSRVSLVCTKWKEVVHAMNPFQSIGFADLPPYLTGSSQRQFALHISRIIKSRPEWTNLEEINFTKRGRFLGVSADQSLAELLTGVLSLFSTLPLQNLRSFQLVIEGRELSDKALSALTRNCPKLVNIILIPVSLYSITYHGFEDIMNNLERLENFSLAHFLSIRNLSEIPLDMIKRFFIKYGKDLKTVSLNTGSFDGHSEYVSLVTEYCPNLTSIQIKENGHLLKVFESCPHITSLSLIGDVTIDEDFPLSHLRRLRTFTSWQMDNNLMNKWLTALGQIPPCSDEQGLESITIGCNNIKTESFLLFLERHKKSLTYIHLNMATSSQVAALQQCPKLDSLSFYIFPSSSVNEILQLRNQIRYLVIHSSNRDSELHTLLQAFGPRLKGFSIHGKDNLNGEFNSYCSHLKMVGGSTWI